MQKQQQPIFETKQITRFIKHKLKRTFDKFPGNRSLYIDKGILQLLNFVYEYQLEEFKQEQMLTKSIYAMDFKKNEEGFDGSNTPTIIFFLYPKVESMRIIADMVLHNESQNIKKQYFLLLTPKKDFFCIDELQSRNVLSQVKVESFNFDLIPLHHDLLSLQLNNPFYETIVNKDQNILRLVAESVLRLQSVHGIFKSIHTKGQLSNTVAKLISNKVAEENFEKVESEYEITMFMFDRSCDLVTPMLTPFTYQALLDMKYTIKLNKIYVKGSLIGEKGESCPYLVYNPMDEVYETINDKYIKLAISELEEKCKGLDQEIRKKPEFENGNITDQILDLQYKSKSMLGKFLAAKNHLSLALELVADFSKFSTHNRLQSESNMVIQKQMNLDNLEALSYFTTPQDLFRLVCLANSIYGGLKQKQLRSIQEMIVRSYGLNHAFTYKNMKQAGLLGTYQRKSNWNEVVKAFNLINEDVNYMNPQDYCYIFIIFASLITRMLQQGIINPKSWNDPKYALVKGPTQIFQLQQQTEYSKKNKKKLYFVYFIGGVSYAQIQSIRFLSKRSRRTIIILTTNTVNGNQLIKQCFEQGL